jgi:peptide/nickel transport system ATP-binding protein
VFKVGTQLLEILRWHAADDGVRRGERNRRHRTRIIELLRRVQLPDPEAALERFPHQFSGGQRQRLVIAAALASSPALVIADEPTTALDVTTQQQIIDLLRDLVGEFGLSMLFVTHDLGVVAQLCDDLCVIYAGKTVESGPTVAVVDRPRHPYRRALLACHSDRATAFTGIPGAVPSPFHAPPGVPFCTALRQGSRRLRSAPPASRRRPNGTADRLRASRSRRRMSEPPVILELRDLRVSLGGRRHWLRRAVAPVPAVGGVSFSVRQGEILGLVGESGCGKTTLGRIVLGLQRETSGEIHLDGRLVSGARPKRARVERNDIHYVHQDAAAALDPWWSIGRTLGEGLIIHGVRKANERRERVREMPAAAGLDASVLPRYPHELSGGQLRRVTLARILVLQPRFIIFDEPTSGLDIRCRRWSSICCSS